MPFWAHCAALAKDRTPWVLFQFIETREIKDDGPKIWLYKFYPVVVYVIGSDLVYLEICNLMALTRLVTARVTEL